MTTKYLFTTGTIEVSVWQWRCRGCGHLSRKSRIKIPVFARKVCKDCDFGAILEAEDIVKSVGKVQLGTRKLVG